MPSYSSCNYAMIWLGWVVVVVVVAVVVAVAAAGAGDGAAVVVENINFLLNN